MSRFRTFANRIDARRFRRAIRQALGLPRVATLADVTIHGDTGKASAAVRRGEAVTTDHGHVFRRPSGDQWAYPIDATVRALEGRVENVAGTDVTIRAAGERDVDTGGDTPWTEDNDD